MKTYLKILTFIMIFLFIAESAPFSSISSSSNLVTGSNNFVFGNTDVGSYFDQNDANAKSASYFTCSSDGQITDIFAYVARAYSPGTGRAAIYADDSGQAGALIAQSFAVSITSAYSWVDFQMPTPVRVNSGVVYWLSICSDESLELSIVPQTGVRALNGNSYSEGFSDPFGYVWATDPAGAMSIYASGNTDNSELSASISPTSAHIFLGRSQEFISLVTGGISPYSLQWYVNDIAVSDGISKNFIFTPTEAGTYTIYLEATDSVNNKTQSNIVSDITVASSQYDFSIMQITDTQNLAMNHPDWYNQLTTWIVDNSAAYNLKMVIHTGDLTENFDQPSEWQNANAAMNILTNNGIPYTWCAGNHDQNGMDNPNSGWVGEQYEAFNPSTFYHNSYWVGDDNQGKNTAVKFSFNGYNFLVINLECQANDATMAWATNLLDTYSSLNYNIIVGTHAFLDSPSMTFSQNLPYTPLWEENFQNLLNNYPRVFMTLNGHTGGWPPGFSVHNQVNGRTQTEFDRQDVEIDEAAAVRIYSFDLDNNIITSSTYSVPTATWITDSGDNFSFSANLVSTGSVPTVHVTPTLVRMDLGQSEMFGSSVSGGTAPYSYQWYLNNSAVLGATSQDWTFTPNAAGNYQVYVTVTDALNNVVQSNVVSNIIVYPAVITSIDPSSTNMHVDSTSMFTSTSTGGLLPYTYQWFYSNGTAIENAATSTLNFMANSTGTYEIYLDLTDNLGYLTQSNTVTINVYSQPSVTISPTSVTMTVLTTQQFMSVVTGGLIPYSYQWYLNDAVMVGATDGSWNFTPETTGNYKVYLNVTDALNLQVQSNIVSDVTVNPQPTNTISPTNVNMTTGSSQTFNSIIDGGSAPYSYQWYQNDTTVIGATSPSWLFTPQSAGTYTIYLNITDNSGVTKKSNVATAKVETPLIANIAPTQLRMYVGENQTFNSSISGGTTPFSYQWYLNDTAVLSATNSNWTFTPTTFGNYSIYLKVTDALDFKNQSNIANVTVYSPLTVSINPTLVNVTVGTPQTFNSVVSGGAQPYTYQWYLNGNQISNAKNSTLIFTPTSPGVFSVYVTVADNYTAISQSNNATVIAGTPMIVNISPSQVKMYLGESQSFNATVAGGSAPYFYQWYLNDTAVLGATNQNWTFTPLVAGNYKVYLNVTDTLGVVSQSNLVTDIKVYSPLTVSISPNSMNITVETSQTFTSVVSGGAQPYAYQWYINGSQVLNANSSVWMFNSTLPGKYLINLKVTDNNTRLSQSNNSTIIVEIPPNVSITPMQLRMNIGQSQTFQSNVTEGTSPYSFQWYLNDTAVLGATNQNWTYMFTVPGNYKVYLNVTDALNIRVQSNVVTDITIYPLLTTSISPTLVNLIVGSQQLFTSTVSGGVQGYSYQWYLNGTAVLGATIENWMFTPTSAGTYQIYLNVTDSNATTAKSNDAFAIVYLPLTVIINPTQVKTYIGQSQIFSSTVSGGTTPYTYQWCVNDTSVSGANSQNFTFTPNLAGHYKVYLNITDALNIKTQSNIVTDITVYSALIASISPSTVNMTVGMQQTFNSTISGGAQPYTYQWYLNGIPVPNTNSSTWTFNASTIGNFTVYLTVTDNNTQSVQSNNATIAVIATSFVITGFNVTSGGSGYTTPHVVLSGGGGTGATATARVSQGVVIGVVLTNPGTGYTSAPTVTLKDPDPRAKGAVVTAELSTL